MGCFRSKSSASNNQPEYTDLLIEQDILIQIESERENNGENYSGYTKTEITNDSEHKKPNQDYWDMFGINRLFGYVLKYPKSNIETVYKTRRYDNKTNIEIMEFNRHYMAIQQIKRKEKLLREAILKEQRLYEKMRKQKEYHNKCMTLHDQYLLTISQNVVNYGYKLPFNLYPKPEIKIQQEQIFNKYPIYSNKDLVMYGVQETIITPSDLMIKSNLLNPSNSRITIQTHQQNNKLEKSRPAPLNIYTYKSTRETNESVSFVGITKKDLVNLKKQYNYITQIKCKDLQEIVKTYCYICLECNRILLTKINYKNHFCYFPC